VTARHHTARSPNRLLLTATVLVTTAALLRLLSPDGEADAGPRPKSGSPHSSSPNRCSAHDPATGVSPPFRQQPTDPVLPLPGYCADAGRR
jgi:hypothetical protein